MEQDIGGTDAWVDRHYINEQWELLNFPIETSGGVVKMLNFFLYHTLLLVLTFAGTFTSISIQEVLFHTGGACGLTPLLEPSG